MRSAERKRELRLVRPLQYHRYGRMVAWIRMEAVMDVDLNLDSKTSSNCCMIGHEL